MPTARTSRPSASLDALDGSLLLALGADPHASVLALARQLGVARNTVHARLRRLEDAGVLGPVARRIRPATLGYELTAFLELSIRQADGVRARDQLLAIPEIIEIHATTGEADLLLRVAARGTQDLLRITEQILAVPGVIRSATAISLDEVLPHRVEPLLERVLEASER